MSEEDNCGGRDLGSSDQGRLPMVRLRERAADGLAVQLQIQYVLQLVTRGTRDGVTVSSARPACDDGTGPLKVGNLWQALRARCAARAWFRRDTLSAAFLTVWRARAPRRGECGRACERADIESRALITHASRCSIGVHP